MMLLGRLEVALAYAGEREVFGRPLTGMQLTQERLAEMVLALQQALTGISACRG